MIAVNHPNLLMAHAEVGAEESQDPNIDGQSAVYLLAEDANNDLQIVPLDGDQPPGPENSSTDDCAVPVPPIKEPNPPIPTWRPQTIAEQTCGPYGMCIMNTFMICVMLAGLAMVGMVLYILYRFAHQGDVLEVLTHKVDSQSDLLRQLTSNQHMVPGPMPGGL